MFIAGLITLCVSLFVAVGSLYGCMYGIEMRGLTGLMVYKYNILFIGAIFAVLPFAYLTYYAMGYADEMIIRVDEWIRRDWDESQE